MSDDFVSRARYGEPFWRVHHEAWCRSDLINESIAKLGGFRSRRSVLAGEV